MAIIELAIAFLALAIIAGVVGLSMDAAKRPVIVFLVSTVLSYVA